MNKQDAEVKGCFSIAIFGGPGGGAVVAHSIRNLIACGGQSKFSGFLNDQLSEGAIVDGSPVLGDFSKWSSLPVETRFIAPLHKAKCMPARAARIVELGVPAQRWCNVVDPTAQIMANVYFGVGVSIAPYTIVQSDVRIDNHVMIRGCSVIGHNCHLSEFAFVGSHCSICGYVDVESGAHFAPGARIREGTHIGRFAVIGLGAIVVRDVPDYAIVAGNPAKIIGRLDPEQTSTACRALRTYTVEDAYDLS